MKATIRIASDEDAEKLLEIYAPYVEHTAISFEYEVPSVEEFAERIHTLLHKYPYLLAEQDGEILGYAYADAFKGREAYDWAVETTIYIKQDKKKKGLGKSLYNALEHALSLQNITNMNACIAYNQEDDEYLTKNSVYFHEHLGYRMVGEFHKCGYKFNRWYDMVWMEKIIGEHLTRQPKMRPFVQVREELTKKYGIK